MDKAILRLSKMINYLGVSGMWFHLVQYLSPEYKEYCHHLEQVLVLLPSLVVALTHREAG
jgi:hypothetical protein